MPCVSRAVKFRARSRSLLPLLARSGSLAADSAVDAPQSCGSDKLEECCLADECCCEIINYREGEETPITASVDSCTFCTSSSSTLRHYTSGGCLLLRFIYLHYLHLLCTLVLAMRSRLSCMKWTPGAHIVYPRSADDENRREISCFKKYWFCMNSVLWCD